MRVLFRSELIDECGRSYFFGKLGDQLLAGSIIALMEPLETGMRGSAP